MSDRRPADYTVPLMLIWTALILLAIMVRMAGHEIAKAKCPTAESTAEVRR